MRNTGVRNPGFNALIALGITLGGAVAIGIGVWIMETEGKETGLSAALIGIGILAAILGIVFVINFAWGIVVFRRIARGAGAIATWTVPPNELDLFREEDLKRSAHGPEYVSDYVPPVQSPAEGLKVTVAADGIMTGDLYFGLSTTGLYRFDAVKLVQREPLALEFRTLHTAVRGATTTTIHTETALWRVPVSRAAMHEAKRALNHFERVLRRETIVNPGFWSIRLKIGLWTAAICAALAAGGYLWAVSSAWRSDEAAIMMVVGILFGLGGLVVAFGSWINRRKQYGR